MPAPDRDQDLLRLPQPLRRRAQHQRLPRVPGPARRAARAEPRGRDAWPCARRWPRTAPCTRRRSSRARTTSTPTSPRATRSRSTTSRWPPRATSRSPPRGSFRRVRLQRIHMEEDAGKLLHEGFPWSAEKSGVDFNRSGVPLIEIVSHPDMRSAEEAYDYLTALKAVLLYASVSDCNMEEGSLRCDANVSVRPRGSEELGTRAEIKNLNSFRNVARAIEHEVARQVGGRRVRGQGGAGDAALERRPRRDRLHALQGGGPRLPLLPGARPAAARRRRRRGSRRCGAALPELPAEKRRRFVAEYGVPDYDAGVLTLSREVADYYETVARESGNAKAASNWVMTEVLRKTEGATRPAPPSPSPAAHLAQHDPPHRHGDDQRQDRQGRLREDVGRRASRPRSSSSARGWCRSRTRRPIRAAIAAVMAARRRPGGHVPQGQDGHPRLVRGPGHEEDGRQGQPAGRQRPPEGGPLQGELIPCAHDSSTSPWRCSAVRRRRCAQDPPPAPRETVTATVGGQKVAVEYGRPSLRGRPITELIAQLPGGPDLAGRRGLRHHLHHRRRRHGRRQEGPRRGLHDVRLSRRRRATGR